jgi:hypothetical protein
MLRPLAFFKNVSQCSRSFTIRARLSTHAAARQTRSLSKPLLCGAASAFTAAFVLQQTITTVHLDALESTKEDVVGEFTPHKLLPARGLKSMIIAS